MASPQHTPFIPPLHTPSANPSPQMPPNIPAPDVPPPAWAREQDQMFRDPRNFPLYPPYGNPYIPAAQPGLRPAMHGLVPGSYFPPPTQLPNDNGYPQTPGHPGGFSHDWMGFPGAFPQFGGHPPTPGWGHGNGPMGPQGPGGAGFWGAFGGQAAYGTPYFGGNGAMPGAFPVATPYGTPGNIPQTPGHRARSAHRRERSFGPQKESADIAIHNRWFEGKHYGPVLEPFVLKAVKADLRVNPLLEPPNDDSRNHYLQWNMLWHSGSCRCTRDDRHTAWTKGRKEPATQPRLTGLRIISEHFPWPINVAAADKSIGVTCGEVIDKIDLYLHRPISKEDYQSLDRMRQVMVSKAYYQNREPGNANVPGGHLHQGMTGVDWLCERTIYGGIRKDERYVKKWFGDVLPGVLVLDCAHSFTMTQEELLDIEAREAERERVQRRRSRRASRNMQQEEDGLDDEPTRGRSRNRGTPAPSIVPSTSTEDSTSTAMFA